jgi:hypothetical protein
MNLAPGILDNRLSIFEGQTALSELSITLNLLS